MSPVIIVIAYGIIMSSWMISNTTQELIMIENVRCMDFIITLIYNDEIRKGYISLEDKTKISEWVKYCEKYTPFDPPAFVVRTYQLGYDFSDIFTNPPIYPEKQFSKSVSEDKKY